jgi:chaperonin GroES
MNQPAIKPIGSHVIIQRSEPSAKSAGGIVLPENAKDKPKEGKVIAVGNGKVLEDGKRQVMQLKSGDRVLFTSYSGSEIKVSGQDYLVMEESDILAVIE